MDWYDEVGFLPGLTDDDAEQLNRLEELREQRPILWSLLRGNRTSRGISLGLMRPHEWVLKRLREYKKDGITSDEEGLRGVVWRVDTDYIEAEYPDLQDFIRHFKAHMAGQRLEPTEEDDVDWANARVLGVWDGKEVVEPPSTE